METKLTRSFSLKVLGETQACLLKVGIFLRKPISSYIVVQQQQVSFFASLKCNFQSFEFYGSGSTENDVIIILFSFYDN